jgi:protein-disulfide isomerase
MLGGPARSLLLGMAATLAACGGSANDIQELKKGQKDILAKLDALDKTVQQVKAQAPPPRPQQDPNKVYNIPIASSPVRGPRSAKVTIVEFSDFQ